MSRTRQASRSSLEIAWSFIKSEITAILLWASLGALCAGVLRLLFSDHAFLSLLKSKYIPPRTEFDDPARYIPYALAVALGVLAIVLIRLPALMSRGARSWWLGVTSGLSFLSFVLTLGALNATQIEPWDRLCAYLAALAATMILAAVLHCVAQSRNGRIPNEQDIKVSVEKKNTGGTRANESDDPIISWAEDTLHRAALVDTLTVKILISKAPVIALFGDFGSGKSSVLNLLREHLVGKAIVVSFSTWLPGSQETLTSYLLSDIANECQKAYFVPGLRRSAGRLARALAESVPLLKGYSQLFPAETQKDDIENLRDALRRLPKRVVVLLDELDRMERDELLPLLKVVRGIASLPNLSFVCAVEPNTLKDKILPEKTSDEQNVYIEKFFPFIVPIPKIDRQLLQSSGIERLIAALKQRSWFESKSEIEDFRKKLEEIWEKRIAPICKNLRAIGLLANDVGQAAAPLRREVDPVDLTLLELLRRFKPEVYEIVARNSVRLTGGESLTRGGSYHGAEELKQMKLRFIEDLKEACPGEDQLDVVRGIIGEMFPDYAKDERLGWALRPKRKTEEEDGKRISNSGMFPAYFRYELPAAIFSSVELETFIEKSKASTSEEAQKNLFVAELRSMPPGSLKRDDFLRKMAEEINTISLPIGHAWVAGAMETAKDLTYDLMTAFGEAGEAIRLVIRVGLRLPRRDRVAFLSKCIIEATDDTMALRILTRLTGAQRDFDLEVTFADLYPSFIKRMRGRYGREVDAQAVDLATSDPDAFNVWGMQPLPKYNVSADPDERVILNDFWIRYIGTSRSRFLKVFDTFILPSGSVDGPTDAFIENKMSVQTVRQLADTLTATDAPSEEQAKVEKKVENNLKRYLAGEFKNGIGIGQLGPYPGQPEDTDEPEESEDEG
jgi:hypothetical protein